MTVSQDLSFVSLISNASLLVQLIMALLVSRFPYELDVYFPENVRYQKRPDRNRQFEHAFWSGGNLQNLYQRAGSNSKTGALERIFHAGMGEYIKGKNAISGHTAQDTVAVLDGARRAMRAAYQREMDSLESHLAFLASVGFGFSLRRTFRYGLGHHECFSRLGKRASGNAGNGCTRYR